MDDDKDGMIEASESSDVRSFVHEKQSDMNTRMRFQFIKEELESNTDAIRHRHFQNADTQITFNDLWSQWQNSIGKYFRLCKKK